MTVNQCKYRTVVIDPPWAVGNGFRKKGFFHGQNDDVKRMVPYQTLTDKEILDFPINDFADENCDLFMWATHTKLLTALAILQAWDFKYHVLMVWDKLSGVCIEGFYRNTELCVFAYRGKKGVSISEGNYLPTLFKAKPKRHSQKPDLFYALLSKRTKEPRIDIFARKRHFGFDAWGDQVESHVEVPLLVALSETKECQSK